MSTVCKSEKLIQNTPTPGSVITVPLLTLVCKFFHPLKNVAALHTNKLTMVHVYNIRTNVCVLKTQLFPSEIFVILYSGGGGYNKHEYKKHSKCNNLCM